MRRIKLISSNSKIIVLATLLIILLSLITIFIPFFLMHLIPNSAVGYYLWNHLYFGYVLIPFLLYIIYTGIYCYKIKIDSYIIDLKSYRAILGIFSQPNYIDIAHSMLDSFSFFNRPFSFNRTLMIKIKTDSGRIIVKRFTLSFLLKKEKERINKVLKEIIAKNQNG